MSKVKFMAVYKQGHKYLFSYRDEQEIALLKSLVNYAKDDRFNIDWKDVLLFVKKLRERAENK